MTCFQAEPILPAGVYEPSKMLGTGQWDLQSLCKVPARSRREPRRRKQPNLPASRLAHCCNLQLASLSFDSLKHDALLRLGPPVPAVRASAGVQAGVSSLFAGHGA